MSGCKMRSQCASTALVKKRPRADRAKAVVEICRHFAQPRANSQNTAIYWKKRTLSSFLFGTAEMEPKARIFQIIFEMWNFMIVWGITNSGEFLLNPPQLSRRLNRYSIRLTFLPETLPNCHKRFTISLLEIHIGFQCQESSYAFAYESLFLFPEILRLPGVHCCWLY